MGNNWQLDNNLAIWQILVIVSTILTSMVVTLIVCILSHFKHNFIKKYNVDNYAVWVGGDDDYLYDIPNICSTCKTIQSYLKMGDDSKLLSPYGFQKNWYLHRGERQSVLYWELSSCLISNLHRQIYFFL